MVQTLEDVKAEARWMVTKDTSILWRNHNHIRDQGEDRVQIPNPEYKQGEQEEGGSAVEEFISVTRTERSERLKRSLIEKVTNVLCFFRGIENEEIRHGGHFLVSKDDRMAGVPNYWQPNGEEDTTECTIENIGDIRAMFDIPFIQHYRKEYYQPDLSAKDLWAIYDLDAKYCSILARQLHLSNIFRDKQDNDGIQLCKQHDSEEGLRCESGVTSSCASRVCGVVALVH